MTSDPFGDFSVGALGKTQKVFYVVTVKPEFCDHMPLTTTFSGTDKI